MSMGSLKRHGNEIAVDRRTTKQLLDAADHDTDKVSVFVAGTNWTDATHTIFVVKDTSHAQYLCQLLERQGLLTPGKSVTGR